MAQAEIQSSLNAGELSPGLYARVDLDKYASGAALMRNFLVDYRGGAINRPGTKFIANLGAPAPRRLIPFIPSTDESYVMVFADAQATVYLNGTFVTGISTPYAAADLPLLKYTQSADVLTLVHPAYVPINITRTGVSSFELATVTVGPTIQPPAIDTMTAPHNGPYNFGYLVTAVDVDGKEESLPSGPGVKSSEGMNETTNRVIGLTWSVPEDADGNLMSVSGYNIYKWGPIDAVTLNPATVWGFIGTSQTTTFTDNNIAPDFSKQPPRYGDPFNGGQFETVRVINGGSGYNGVSGGWAGGAIPYVPLIITGDGLSAFGYAVISHATAEIIGSYLITSGFQYTTATITANGQGGSGATFDYVLTPPTPLYPCCTAYFQQRRAFAGSDLKPETLVMSQIGLYNNFNTTPVALDTDALVLSIAGEQINTIKAMVPVSYGLLLFTTGGSYLLNGGSPYAPLTPASVSVQAQSSVGINDIMPLRVNADVLYVQNKGNRVRNLAFAWQRQAYQGSDISSLAAHLFDGYETVDWTWAEEPFKVVWAVRDDGRMLACTYVPDQEVFAWSRHDTQGEFKSICSVPEGGADAVYVIVERYIPASVEGGDCCTGWVQHLERMASRDGCCLLDSWFLDDAVKLPTSPGFSKLCFDAPTGDTTMTLCDPAVYLRGPDVSYNATNVNGDLFSTLGYFNWTLPDDWDNTDPDNVLVVDFVGGVVVAEGVPADISFFPEFGIYTIDGGWANEGPYSASGDTYAIGTVVRAWAGGGAGSDPWTTPGLNQSRLGYEVDPTAVSSGSATLVDGAGIGFPGEGVSVSTVGGGTNGIGWWPDPGSANLPDGTTNILLEAGQNVTFWFYLFSSAGEVSAPDLSAFGAIQSITLTYKGVAYSVPLADVQVGWNVGDSYNPALDPPNPGIPPIYPNPLRSVEHTPPAVDHPDHQVFIDFYLTEQALAPGEVVQVGCAQATVTGGENPVYDVSIVGTLAEFVIPNDPLGQIRRIEPEEWTYVMPTGTLTGLDHLEGKEVWALGDGEVLGPFEVSAGEVTVSGSATYASLVAGLSYTSQLKTLYLTVDGLIPGTIQGKRKFTPAATLRVECTLGLSAGIDFDHLTPVPDLAGSVPFTGDARVVVFSDWTIKAEVCVEQTQPLPATVLGIITEVTAGDTGR